MSNVHQSCPIPSRWQARIDRACFAPRELRQNRNGVRQPLVAGDPVVGIAYEEINNTGAAGAKSVRVYTLGDFEHALSGAAIADVGRPVFASADDTLTYVANGNSYAGVVQDVPSSGNIILRLDTQRRMVKTVVHSVEDLAAGADIAARSIHSFNKEGWIVDARVVNQATAASGIDDSNTCVITVAIDAGTVVAETFDSTTTFPAANASQNLGTLANTHAAAGDVRTLARPAGLVPRRDH